MYQSNLTNKPFFHFIIASFKFNIIKIYWCTEATCLKLKKNVVIYNTYTCRLTRFPYFIHKVIFKKSFYFPWKWVKNVLNVKGLVQSFTDFKCGFFLSETVDSELIWYLMKEVNIFFDRLDNPQFTEWTESTVWDVLCQKSLLPGQWRKSLHCGPLSRYSIVSGCWDILASSFL